MTRPYDWQRETAVPVEHLDRMLRQTPEVEPVLELPNAVRRFLERNALLEQHRAWLLSRFSMLLLSTCLLLELSI